MTVEGTFPLVLAASAVAAITHGINPFLATLIADWGGNARWFDHWIALH